MSRQEWWRRGLADADKLVGGVVLGVAFSWGVIFAAIMAALAIYGVEGSGETRWFDVALGVLVFLAAPVVSLVMLLRSRTRTMFLIGLAIGSIVGSGVCASFFHANQ